VKLWFENEIEGTRITDTNRSKELKREREREELDRKCYRKCFYVCGHFLVEKRVFLSKTLMNVYLLTFYKL